MAEEEKEALFKKMHAYSVELGQATQNVIELKRHIAEHSGDFGVSNRSLRALAVIASKLAEEPQSLNADLTESQIQKFFRSTKYELPVPMRSQLFSDGLIRADESLSSDAIKIICKFLD
ncbi:hypothetical protein [Teredinibacter turnerae]|uniref:hypothetical protein n=1 Tax=Teredinibacter turnerae TaxID=2426 RepID=UPI0030CD92AA